MPKGNSTPVVAAQFNNETDAFLAKGLLASEGIEAWVEPNIMATLYGAGATWAPLNLYVITEKLEEAKRILNGDNR